MTKQQAEQGSQHISWLFELGRHKAGLEQWLSANETGIDLAVKGVGTISATISRQVVQLQLDYVNEQIEMHEKELEAL